MLLRDDRVGAARRSNPRDGRYLTPPRRAWSYIRGASTGRIARAVIVLGPRVVGIDDPIAAGGVLGRARFEIVAESVAHSCVAPTRVHDDRRT